MTSTDPKSAETCPTRGENLIRREIRSVLQTAVLGGLIALGLSELGLIRVAGHSVLLGAAAGLALGFTRARHLVPFAAAGVILLLLVFGYTPLSRVMLRGLERHDTLRPAPAVVVLGTFARRDGSLSGSAQDRALHGYLLLSRGYADRLVLTRPDAPAPPWDQTVRSQMSDLHLTNPVDVVGPVTNTHDEAVAVAQLAKQRGWDTVILVTHSWHTRRAAAAFEAAGLHVICSPCPDGEVDLTGMSGPGDRLGVLRRWVYETCAYGLYAARGWV
jgi:uncharacterized SAM-binding protein YcdF (DUF218 family)